MITVKDVLQNKPRGAFIYKIMYNKEIPFYVGMSLRDIQARFKTHMAKFYGEKKYPDRERCQEVVTEHEDLRFKCTGRQTHGYRTIREIFRKHDIDFDFFNINRGVFTKEENKSEYNLVGINLNYFKSLLKNKKTKIPSENIRELMEIIFTYYTCHHFDVSSLKSYEIIKSLD